MVGELQSFDKSVGVERFEDQEFCDTMQFNEVAHDKSLVGAEVDMQIGGTAENMQYFLDSMLCSNDQQSQQQMQSQQQPATAITSGMRNNVLISHDHESPRDQNFVGASDGYKPATASATATAAHEQASASALHTVHGSSFIGFGGSDLGNRRGQDINKHYDDVTGWNDVGSCGEFGGE